MRNAYDRRGTLATIKALYHLSFGACAALVAGSGYAETKSEVRKTIQASYDRQNAAISRKDAKGSLAALAPNWTGRFKNSETYTYTQALQGAYNICATASTISAKTTIRSFQLRDPRAIVTVSQKNLFVLTKSQTQETVRVTNDDVNRDVWMRTPAGWRIQTSTRLVVRSSVNGKPTPDK